MGGAHFLPAVLKWLAHLMWLQPDDGLPQGHKQVSFMELALDFQNTRGATPPAHA